MKIKKGMAVNVEGINDTAREAVVKKFEALGFGCSTHFNRNGNLFYIAFTLGSLHSIMDTELKDLTEITLSDLMFCDQPDDVISCHLDTRSGCLIYTPKDKVTLGTALELICTREARPKQLWYECHTKEIGRLTEFMVKNGIGAVGESCIDVAIRELSEKHNVQSERDKLIEEGLKHCFAPKSNSTKITVEALVDAGWRPSND